jgi:hypothetical protein
VPPKKGRGSLTIVTKKRKWLNTVINAIKINAILMKTILLQLSITRERGYGKRTNKSGGL